MTLNRRTLIISGGAAIAVAGFAAYGLFGHQITPVKVSPIGEAAAQDRDLSDLSEPPELGEMALGSDDAPVTVIEYASATCPHCARFHVDTFPTLKQEYVDTGKVRFVFREFPFDDLALAAFMLARCAPEDKYFPIIDVVFEKQQSWVQDPREELFRIAQLAGFSREHFDECLNNEDIAKGILAIRAKAAESYGVNSTPTFFVNGEVIEGNQSIEQFRTAIDNAAG